ncbi:MAG: Sua5/YciO/YrdC/YwlC family protein, partial [Candidatus Niyogibacteria bacterium]|nr:Sua5/YciO/YrdC/YwlC family protein [Candidatus Niyogibacteria bacterium]
MEILKVGKNNFKEAVGRAVEVLASAGVVVVPTDTVYGLAADAVNENAVRKVFE